MAKKGVSVLIKLKKREVDDLRKEITALERQAEMLVMISAKMSEQLAAEAALIARQPEIGGYYGAYSQRIRKRQWDISQEVRLLNEKADALRGKLAEKFGEQKRYELVEANAQRRVQKEQMRKEQILLDEIGSQRTRRETEYAE